ncbi:MAG: hypothetical protein QM640_16980 [Niabella sp.]
MKRKKTAQTLILLLFLVVVGVFIVKLIKLKTVDRLLFNEAFSRIFIPAKDIFDISKSNRRQKTDSLPDKNKTLSLLSNNYVNNIYPINGGYEVIDVKSQKWKIVDSSYPFVQPHHF